MQKINWKNIAAEQVNPKMKRQFIHGEKIMIAKSVIETIELANMIAKPRK